MKLLVMDVEGTLFENGFIVAGADITSTIWQGIAVALGPEAVAAEVATHERWRRGDYRTYVDWMKDTIEIHKRFGLSQDAFNQVVLSARYNTGVEEFFATLDRSEYQPVLVSGGFAELARRVQVDFGVHHAFAACQYYFEGGTLRSYNLLPCDFEGKIDFIGLMLAEYGLAESEWIFVGDGANDVPIAARAPWSIAYRPHHELAAVASSVHDDYASLAEEIRSLKF
jgi:phosphoserine phosphatase